MSKGQLSIWTILGFVTLLIVMIPVMDMLAQAQDLILPTASPMTSLVTRALPIVLMLSVIVWLILRTRPRRMLGGGSF